MEALATIAFTLFVIVLLEAARSIAVCLLRWPLSPRSGRSQRVSASSLAPAHWKLPSLDWSPAR